MTFPLHHPCFRVFRGLSQLSWSKFFPILYGYYLARRADCLPRVILPPYIAIAFPSTPRAGFVPHCFFRDTNHLLKAPGLATMTIHKQAFLHIKPKRRLIPSRFAHGKNRFSPTCDKNEMVLSAFICVYLWFSSYASVCDLFGGKNCSNSVSAQSAKSAPVQAFFRPDNLRQTVFILSILPARVIFPWCIPVKLHSFFFIPRTERILTLTSSRLFNYLMNRKRANPFRDQLSNIPTFKLSNL